MNVCWLVGWMLLGGVLSGQAEPPGRQPPLSRADIPYVPTRHDTVRDLLWLADVSTNDVVYDLGSGDGRVVIAAVRQFGARRAVGVELDARLVQQSRENAAQAGVADRVKFVNGDLFTNDLHEAGVVALYLGHTPNLDLRAHLVRSLKPGARVVSHQFGMGEWTPDKTLDVRTALLGMYSEMANPFSGNPEVPDFCTPMQRMNHDVLSAWLVPAPVAGVWRGSVVLDSKPAELTITLHQRLSGLSGSFLLAGATNAAGQIQADLWGTHVRLHCIPTNGPYGGLLLWFDGQAQSETLQGKCWVSRRQGISQCEWTARREKKDFTGTWQWAGPRNLPVQLKLERQGGRLSATYTDANRDVPIYAKDKGAIPVTDLYDFGGGFYFTLFLGREGSVRRTGPEDGWVVGEAVMADDSLRGTLAFYPYPQDGGAFPAARAASVPPKPELRTGRGDWRPQRVGNSN